MMSSRDYSKPIRPPRGTKAPKETTGHLMKIIGTLSNHSKDNADRDNEKKKLEKEFYDCDKKLNYFVEDYRDDLSNVMQAFSKVYLNVKTSKGKCQDMKEMLTRCKKLLHCKRHELKRLWLEVVEHKQVLNMLKEIDTFVGVPQNIELFLKGKMYHEATELMVSSVLLLEGSLESVDALKELKAEIYLKRKALHDTLVQELHTLLYLTSTNHILKRFKRHGSGRLRNLSPGVFVDSTCFFSKETSNKSASMNNLTSISNQTSSSDDNFSEVDVKSSISNIVDCIKLLNRIPETAEIIKTRCEKELLAIVRRTAQHVAESSKNATFHQSVLGSVLSKEQQFLLLDLLELIFEQFKCVARIHKSLLKNLELGENEEKEGEDYQSYDMSDIWSKMQAVLEITIGEYVDIHNTNTSQPSAPPSFSNMPTAVDISSYFLRKRTQRQKNYALFKFESSSHAISMKTYLQEQKALKEKGDMDAFDSETEVFFCPPSIKNITTIYRPLSKYITEMEEELGMESGANCLLHIFMSSCVSVFLGQVSLEVTHLIENASKSLENWRAVSDPDALQNAGVKTKLLHSAICIDNGMKDLKDLIYALPKYSNFLNIMHNMLEHYRDSCQTGYASLIQPLAEDKRIISASWAKDKDISRLLKSLPNWVNLKEKNLHDFEESPEEVRLRNKKESEILIANLLGDDTLIAQHEVLPDPHHLHNLALLHESMAWLGSRILTFVSNLSKHQSNSLSEEFEDEEVGNIPDGLIDSLTQTEKEYENLADTCLLVLHLEVRVHCFYYLQPLALQGSYATRLDSQEPDPEIIKLNSDLSKIDESLQSVLKPCNIKYIFEGIGELISTILINSTNKIKRINENGIKKMIRNIHALQQNVTGITMFREVALDRARQYFDLLNLTPEEILNLIVENGPQFQELEYVAAFQLLHRSQPGSDSSVLSRHLERLHQILNEVAVSV